MPSSYTLNLGIEKPATGEQAGVWGNTANSNYDWIDTACDGNLEIELAAPTYTLSTNQGADSEGRNKVITFTGALTGDASVNIIPKTAEKIYFFRNYTTGGKSIIFQQGTGPSFTLKNGYAAIVYADGFGNAASVHGVIDDLQVTSIVATRLTVTETVTIQAPVTYTQPVTFATTTTFTGAATFNGGVTLNLGGDAPDDLYYRGATGPLARLAIGTAGQVLISNPGPAWSHTLPAALTFSAQCTFSAGFVATTVTLNGPVTITLPNGADWDLYLRGPGGPLARLPVGAANMVLIVSGASPAWSNTLAGVYFTNCVSQGEITLNVGSDAANDMYYRSATGLLARIPAATGLLAMGPTPGWYTNIGPHIQFTGGASIYHPAYLNTPGAAPYDLFYRHPDAWTASLPKGAAGQFLRADAAGYSWVTIQTSIGIGTPVVGASANYIFYGGAGGVLSQHGHLIFNGTGLGLGINPARTLHLGGGMAGQIWLDGGAGPAGAQRHLAFASSSVARWLLIATNEPESGGNVGSYLVLQRCADDGGVLSNVLSMFRNSGNMTVGVYADLGGQLNVWGQNAAAPATVVRGANLQTGNLQEWQNNAGTILSRIDSTGRFIGPGQGLQPVAGGAYDIYGSVGGHPLGTLHIGPEGAAAGGVRPCIVMEQSSGSVFTLPLGCFRMYMSGTGNFVIQYRIGAANWFAVLPLTGTSGPGTWTITSAPQ